MRWKWTLPETVIFALAALLPAYRIRFQVGPVPTTLLEIAALIAIAALAVSVTPTKVGVQAPSWIPAFAGMTKRNRLLAVGSALLIIATVIGIVVAPDTRAALGIAKTYFWEPMLVAWLLIASRPDGKRAYRALVRGLALSAAAVIGYGLLQYAFPHLIAAPWAVERRITSVFDFPNAAALFLAPTLPLFVTSARTAALAFGGVITIALARSAGGLVSAAASLGFMGVMSKRWRRLTLIVAAFVVSVTFFAPFTAGLRSQLLLQDWSGRVHLIGWQESTAMLRDRPVFGAGLSGYPAAVAPYHTAQGVEIFQYPHNLILAIWSELGLLGLAGFACVLIWFFRISFKIQDPGSKIQGLTLSASMLALLIHGLVDVPYFKYDLALLFWLFITIVAL
jgi:O-antigen ligase